MTSLLLTTEPHPPISQQQTCSSHKPIFMGLPITQATHSPLPPASSNREPSFPSKSQLQHHHTISIIIILNGLL
jgi:hypothetical protein